MKKPTGQFRCIACAATFPGRKLRYDDRIGGFECAICGGNVTKVEQPALPLDDKPAIEPWNWNSAPGFAKNRNKKRR